MGLRICLLGELTAEADGLAVALPPGRRLAALLGWLALHPGPQPRAKVAGLLWPDVPEASARASLRSAVWAARGALRPGGERCPGGDCCAAIDGAAAPGQHVTAAQPVTADQYLTADRYRVGLRVRGLTVDVTEFERLAGCGKLAEAAALCRGELLPGLDEAWALDARDQHSERLSAVLAKLTCHAAAEGRTGAALAWARRRAALRPLDEDAGRDLITCLAASGDPSGAVAAYQGLRRRLGRELGAAPTPATRRAAQSSRAAVPLAATTHATTTRARTNTSRARAVTPPVAAATPPVEVTGRDRELGVLISAWDEARAGAGQAVFLTGEGGIGKTALADAVLNAARQHGAAVVACHAGGGPPFGLWPEALAKIASECGPPPAGAPWARDLAALLPTAGPLPDPAGPPGSWPPGSSPTGPRPTDSRPADSRPADSRPAGPRSQAEPPDAGSRVERAGPWSREAWPPAAWARETWAGDAWPRDASPAGAWPGGAWARGSRGPGRARLFEAVVCYLAWASGQRPLALVLDDLHLADGASLSLLGYAGHRVLAMRMLLVLAARPLPPRAALDSVAGSLQAHGALAAELALGGLPGPAARRLARRTARLGGPGLDRAVAVAGGNPRLLVAAARTVAAGGSPDGLLAAVATTLRGLRAPARRFLEFAALSGRPLCPAEVAALPLPDPVMAATEALGSGLLRPAGDTVGYRHPLVSAAVRQQIPAPLRGRLRALLTSSR